MLFRSVDSGKPDSLYSMSGNRPRYVPTEAPMAFLTHENYDLLYRLLQSGPVQMKFDLRLRPRRRRGGDVDPCFTGVEEPPFDVVKEGFLCRQTGARGRQGAARGRLD